MSALRNRAVVARVAARDYRASGTRNRWTIAAIALAAFLVLTVLSVGASYVESLRSREVVWSGMAYDASLQGPTPEQLEAVADLDGVARAGLRVAVGSIVEHRGRDVDVDLLVSDATNWDEQVLPAVERLTGRYPTAGGELLLSTTALDRMGIDEPRIGMPLDVGVLFRGDASDADAPAPSVQDRTFTLVGYYKDQTTKVRAYGSDALRVESGVPRTDKIASTLYLTLEDPYLDAAGVERLSSGLGVERNQTFRADATGLRTLRIAVAAAAGLVLMIGASAVLVVRSLLSIWLDRQVRVYGLLATVGTTRTQLRRIVRRQVVRLGAVGILIGVSLGLLVSVVVVPAALRPVTPGPITPIPPGLPVVLLVSAAVVGLTVALSARGPLRTVAELAPVEAVRHVSASVRAPRGTRRPRPAVVRLAGRALGSDRRRTASLVSSFVLALLCCLVGASLVASNSSARVLDELMESDMVLVHVPPDDQFARLAAQEAGDGTGVPDPLDRELVAALEGTPGVASVQVLTATPVAVPAQPAIPESYYTEFFDRITYWSFDEVRDDFLAHPESYAGSVIGIDDEQLAELNAALGEPVDPDDFRAGHVAILSSFASMTDWPAESVVGQDVTVRTPDGATHVLRVAGATTRSPLLPTGVSPDLLVSEQLAESIVGTPPIRQVSVRYERAYDQDAERAVRALIPAGAESLDVQSKLDALHQMENGARQLSVLGVAIAGVLMLVALVNFATVIVASSHARGRELAVLEALGATRTQLRRAAVLEGAGYWLMAAPLSVALAIPVGAAAFGATDEFGTGFVVPAGVVAAVLVGVAAVCVTVPVLGLRHASRGELVDRLR